MMKLPVPSAVKTISAWSKPLLPYVDASNKYLYDQIGLFENEILPKLTDELQQKFSSSFLKKNGR